MQPLREVYSLLMPVKDGRIIVPRAAVAEVMGYTKPKNRPDNAPDFVLGFIEWQGQKIPLVSFEAARGKGVPELGRRTRIAVVFGIAGRLDPDVFAVVTQGYPYLVRVNENVLKREEMETSEPLVLARVRMANEKPYIPNFEKLEVLIAEGLGITVPDAANEPVDELDMPLDGGEEEFDAGAMEEQQIDESGAPEPEAAMDFDIGEVTAFGTDTSYSSELDELSGALENNAKDIVQDEQETDAIDLGEVTAFGVETNYSVELNELTDALPDEDKPTAAPPGDDFSAIDLSGLELGETGDGDGATEPEEKDSSDNIGEIDLSGLELDEPVSGDEAGESEEKKSGGDAGEIDISGLELDSGDEKKEPE